MSDYQHSFNVTKAFQQNAEIVLGKKTNILLVRDDVGKAKPTTKKLPQSSFSYGKANPKGNVTANNCLTDWQFHTKSTQQKPDPRDFKKLNKLSVLEGQHTCAGQTNFRQSHDARIPFGIIREKNLHLPESSHSFGRKNRAQTPVNNIIQHKYLADASVNMQERYALAKDMQKTQTRGLTGIRMTNAEMNKDKYIKARLTAQSALEQPREQFKLKRFTQVDPRTSTKRGDQPFMSMKLMSEATPQAQVAERLEPAVE